ncbi:hypothetical protein K438DRAFT_1833079, partial [Mycena galopus ATCC 62051]
LTLAASGILGVLGSPALQASNVTTHPTPHGFTAFDIPESVDAAPTPSVPAHEDAVVAASTNYWVCVAVSTWTGRYGWSQGGSESSALQNAKKKCGKDCTSYVYSCIAEGCVGIDYGSTYVALSYARGYGRNDGSKAANTALLECKKKSKRCGKPGYFCAERIY